MHAKDAPALRAYLVDDEPLAVRSIATMLEDLDGVSVVGQACDPAQALAFLSVQSVDLLFLDIHMPGLSGFALLGKLQHPPAVVFTTAYDEYAVQAFRADAIDYLLKPVRPDEVARALRKAARLIRSPEDTATRLAAIERAVRQYMNGGPKASPYPTRITSRVGGRIHVIDLGQVTHFMSEGNLTYAVTPDQRHIVDISLAELEQKLDPNTFVRIHRATLVNVSRSRRCIHGPADTCSSVSSAVASNSRSPATASGRSKQASVCDSHSIGAVSGTNPGSRTRRGRE